jgi:hypothetical protein
MRSLLTCLVCLTFAAPASAMLLDPQPPVPRQDLRSPDARDAALPRPTATPAPSADGELPWALVGGGLGALLLGGVAARRRVMRLRMA